MFEQFADVVTVGELAKMLKVGRNTAYDLVKSGALPSVKVKTQIRIPKEAVITFMHNNRPT